MREFLKEQEPVPGRQGEFQDQEPVSGRQGEFQDREPSGMQRAEKQEPLLTPRERRFVILGALKAALLIGLAFIGGLGLVVLALIALWTLL